MNVIRKPVQELPENQDPGVAFVLNEQTGVRVPLKAAPKPKRARKKPADVVAPVEVPVEAPAPEHLADEDEDSAEQPSEG